MNLLHILLLCRYDYLATMNSTILLSITMLLQGMHFCSANNKSMRKFDSNNEFQLMRKNKQQ